ncbi:zinc finger CHY domain protein [Halorubrum saccharovorum DSM 1137]|uniref:Zinc finger CHY domain protein n=1 Tax=Halorubrum saccharovorum DSM 1137 TaxID=1227484 RepID=M0E4M8_9EURY|nr:CHY zinc finger protein [Halorubrum saccharovorum]ELZ42735.1 zinc finger CHY domain protein [Halorubrum saccharovorum DSM 1137]
MDTPPTDDRRTTTAPATDDRFSVPLRGVAVDPETRCAHWDSAVDVVALRFGCCETYYPCDACHDAATDHEAEPWPRDRFDEAAVLCGACGATLTAREYLDGDSEGQSPSGNRAPPDDGEAQRAAGSRERPDDDACPRCDAAFNPGCRAHRDRYFEV